MWSSLLLGSILAAAPAEAVVSWDSFRGNASGQATVKNLPTSWSPKENISWRVTTPGYGQSSPVVWTDNIYVTSIEGELKEKLHVTCVSLATGKQLWTKSFEAAQKGKNNPMMSRAAGTPVVDAAGVYASFESGNVIALDHEGKLRWERKLGDVVGELKNNHGLGSSPTQTADDVIVLVDHQGPGKLFALDKATGKDHWATDRTARSSWTSPIVVEHKTGQQIVISSGGTVTGYDAKTGKQRWEKEGIVGNSIPSATAIGSNILIAASENRMKPDAEGTSKSNCCLKLTEDGNGVETLWAAKKLAAGTASPVVMNGFAYYVDKSALVVCVDATTGEEKYRERLDQLPWASPVVTKEAIYFFGKDGATTVLKPGASYEKISTSLLWSAEDSAARKEAAKKAQPPAPTRPEGAPRAGGGEGAVASALGDVLYGVAAVDGVLLLRTGTELFCIKKK